MRRPAQQRICTKWELPVYFKESLPLELCSAANMVLMNDVDMVIEIAKELGWKDELKPVAEFVKETYEIREDKEQLEKNYDLKFDQFNKGFIENHVEFEQRRYREASFHVKAKLCGLTFSTTWQGKPVLESRPIHEWEYKSDGRDAIYSLTATQGRRSDPLYYRTVKWGS